MLLIQRASSSKNRLMKTAFKPQKKGASSEERSRMRWLRAALCAMLALCLFALGCSSPQESPYGSADASGELHIVLDSRLEYNSAAYAQLIEEHIKVNMPNVSCVPQRYMDIESMEQAIEQGEDIDLVIVPYEEMDRLRDKGYVDTNKDALNVGKVPIVGSPLLRIVRKKGSTATLPDTRIVGGNDNIQSNEWRLAYLPDSDLTIAVLPDDDSAGIAANQALASVGLYSEEEGSGGSYAASIAERITVAESGADAIELVENGTCDIAFLCDWDAKGDAASCLDVFYEVPRNLYREALHYKAGVLKTSKNLEAARHWIAIAYWL